MLPCNNFDGVRSRARARPDANDFIGPHSDTPVFSLAGLLVTAAPVVVLCTSRRRSALAGDANATASIPHIAAASTTASRRK